ncbi:hypothetical protein WJX84_011677 [Apatococcus fuscideae]|uniref:Uncharacterized protein n=1 Tax=Apatococcus fuscideae TaxID=2026836 RepID=A0AAW1TGW9_9CHLO
MGHACISIRTLRCGFLTSAEQLGYQANAGITSTQWMLRRMHKTQMLSQKRPDNPQRQALGNQAATLLMYWSGIWWSRFVGVCDSKCQPHVWQTDHAGCQMGHKTTSVYCKNSEEYLPGGMVVGRDGIMGSPRGHEVQNLMTAWLPILGQQTQAALHTKLKQEALQSLHTPWAADSHTDEPAAIGSSFCATTVTPHSRRQGSSGPAPQAPECAGRIGIHDNISIAIEVGRRHSYTAARKAACSSQGRWEQDKRRQDSHCQRQATRASPAVVIVARTEDTWREITSIFQSLSCLAYLAFGANSCHIEQGLLPL